MQRRHDYERAFEQYVRARRIPYVAVDEARKALLPGGRVTQGCTGADAGDGPNAIKSFDFVIYGQSGTNLLIDIKGRRVAPGKGDVWRPGRLESWVTLEDVRSLERWEELFGPGFSAAFVFIYRCDAQPPDALFQEILAFEGSWYALRAVHLSAYREAMKTRSPRWGTVYIPSAAFERISQPFAPALEGRGAGRSASGLFEPENGSDLGPDLPVLMPHAG